MSLQSDKSVQVSLGFCLLIAWFAAVNGWRLLAVILGAAVAHELGHWAALRLLGAKILGLRVGILGAVLETDCRRLSYGRELAAVLAGPGTNLLCAWLLSKFGDGMEIVVGAHLVLGCFNLVPVRPLDGGQAFYLLVTCFLGPSAGEQAARWLGAITAVILTVGICGLMEYTGGSLWLFPAAAGLLMTAVREFFGKASFS